VKPPGDLQDVTFIALMGTDVCAVVHGGLTCWGSYSGGDGSIVGQGATGTPLPQAVITDPIAAVAGGVGSRCVLKIDGSVWCWGYGADFNLGTGSTADSAVPAMLTSLGTGVGAIQTTLGTFAIKDDDLFGWGSVDGSAAPVLEPTKIVLSDPASQAAIIGVGGTRAWTCALGNDSRVWCWVIGSPNLLTSALTPAEIDVGDVSKGLLEIAVGDAGLCRLDTGGTVQCAGRNDHGQLGDGTTTDRGTMAPVVGLPGPALHITAGEAHACAVLQARTLWCWGANGAGELGVGDTADRLQPVQVGF